MSDTTAAALGPVFAYAMIALFRALRSPVTRPAAKPARSAVDLRPRLRRVIPPPSAALDVPDSPATLRRKWPLPSEGPIVVSVESWERGEELLAWRFWKLGRLRSDGGVRLLSFRAPCAWDGPVLRAHRLPSESPFSATGVYALKAEPPRGADVHHSDECWVSGWVALSGRVVEHEHGYRSERAVIRQLRLGLGLHLRFPALQDIVMLAAELERRYQAPVDLGVVPRSVARDILAQGKDQWIGGIPEIPEGFRVEYVRSRPRSKERGHDSDERRTQRFTSAFVEHVDWVNGNDSQYRTVMPVTEAEAAGLSGQSAISVIEILNRLPRERRSLQDDEGASWSNGMWILP